jgi:hypothetical protein
VDDRLDWQVIAGQVAASEVAADEERIGVNREDEKDEEPGERKSSEALARRERRSAQDLAEGFKARLG